MKQIAICLVFLTASIVFAKKGGSSSQGSDNDILKGDFGGLKSCNPSLSQFEIKWSPKEFKYDQETTGSGYIIPNMDASEIRACVNVTVDGIEGPLYSGCANGGCAKLKQYFPQYAKFCPLHKGRKVQVKSFKQKFNPEIQLTPGTYHILANIYDIATNAPIACVAGDVTIADDYEYDYNDFY